MKELLLNLQLFGEGGGDGASAGAEGTAGTEVGVVEGAPKSAKRGKGNPLQDVVYGKQDNDGSIAEPKQVEVNTPKTRSQEFEDLIKGDYKEEFNKRTQDIINKRFKETKGLEERLESHNSILNRLADKYGVESGDAEAILKALDEDDSFYEQEAMEKGLTVKQLKELKALQRENENFRKAEEEAERRQHSQQIYSQWEQEAEALKAKYGLDNFTLQEEALNPDFTKLLQSGISVEAAYKAIHIDDMIGGAMAKTASEVKTQLANSIASRNGRPTENGISQQTSQVFKRDVNSLTKKDREEIERRVMRGAIISF